MLDRVVDIRRSDSRLKTQIDWLDSRHSFSFGGHWEPDNTHHGLLLVSNDDVVRPTSGFMTHPHKDMEIVTWVLDGELEHKDTLHNSDIIYPGLAQRMSAGRGIYHSEMNNSTDTDVHLVQMWVVPDTSRIDPGYEQLDITSELAKGGLVPLASGRPEHSAIRIQQKHATLWVGRLKPGEVVTVPDAAYAHVFVAKGRAELQDAGWLETGDAARLTAAGDPRLTADPVEGAEVLIWEMDGTIRWAA